MDNTDDIIKDLHAEAALLLKEDNDDAFIIDSLMQKGINRHYAEMVLENVRSDVSYKKAFYKLLLMGISFTGSGTIMTLMGYQHPLPGGTYFIFYGIIVYGVSLLARAFILFRK